MMAKQVRAAIYARYSSENQRAASIEDQIRLCKERVAAQGWELVQVFRDAAISGGTFLRPGYQAMLEWARNAGFDVVLAEALDRLSRDQEDVAALYKRLQFGGIRLVTLAEGDITELHVGLKGTMNALFLKDLADKTRRGLRGRIEAGRSGGGNCYGYDVIQAPLGSEPSGRGSRAINEAEAEIVRRIFREYVQGISPKALAHRLNAENIPGPRGGRWSPSTINGNRERGTGILNNEIYAGRLVWNRLRYSKDPDTGKRISRPNAATEIVVKAVPELRIVPDELWEAVRTRQDKLARKQGVTSPEPTGFWTKQRPRHLFSGLMQCGICGGGFSKISATHFGCSTARNKGPKACGNRLTIRRDVLEATVVEALQVRLMDPDLFKAFAEAFVTEWNDQQAKISGDRDAQEGELNRVRRRIAKLVDALADGVPASSVRDRLAELEGRRQELEVKLAQHLVVAPRLHPSLPEIYRQKVSELVTVLNDSDGAEAREIIRGLVEAITLIPEEGRLRVAVRGELAMILQLASAGKDAKSVAVASGALAAQLKLVAGTGFEPVTFRL